MGYFITIEGGEGSGKTSVLQEVIKLLNNDGYTNIVTSREPGGIKIATQIREVLLDKENTMIVSPDEGAMSRCMYYSSVLGMNLGTFYKRRDYSRVVNGKNPIVAHEFLGTDIEGKNIIVVDDMIASGDSMIDVSKELKKRKANKVVIFSTFGLFTEGFDKFDKAHEEGLIDAVFTTNLVYDRPGLLEKAWYKQVDMTKYIALIISELNAERSISTLLNPIGRIEKVLEKYRNEA